MISVEMLGRVVVCGVFKAAWEYCSIILFVILFFLHTRGCTTRTSHTPKKACYDAVLPASAGRNNNAN